MIDNYQQKAYIRHLEKLEKYTLMEFVQELDDLINYIKVQTELKTELKAGFNSDQPRVPAGNPDGGQWGNGGGGGGAGRFEGLPHSETEPSVGEGHSRNLTGVRTTHFKDLDGKIRKIPEGVGNPGKFQSHVEKHAKNFNSKSGNDYLNKALKFKEEGIRENFPMVEDKKGVLRIYDPKTNRFGSYNPDGSLKTYMLPKENDPVKGYKYYQNIVNDKLRDGGKEINKLPPINSGGGGW